MAPQLAQAFSISDGSNRTEQFGQYDWAIM